MDTLPFSSLAQLSDKDLLAKVAALAAEERQATALLIAHLAELDARRLYLAEGYSSLFNYCTQALHLSEYAAYHRIQVARASREFPVLLELLSEGALTLTTVGLLAPHLTAENHEGLLEEARFKSKRVVEELIASLFPRPTVPIVLRRLPLPRSNSSPSVRTDDESAPGNSVSQQLAGAAPSPTPAAVPVHKLLSTMKALAPERYKVQFTASKETYEKLRQAQNLLRHQIPDGDLDQVIQRALTVLLHDLAKQKMAATSRPKSRPKITGSLDEASDVSKARESRHIPAEVRRAVWVRDGGRCAFVGSKGRRCTEEGFLEFHHLKPFADGGAATLENIQLRCRAHNGYEAELYFGPRPAVALRGTQGSGSNWVRTQLFSTTSDEKHFTRSDERRVSTPASRLST